MPHPLMNIHCMMATRTPALQAWRRTAVAMEVLLRVLEAEIPDTAATLRLSGLELADAIEEVSLLG